MLVEKAHRLESFKCDRVLRSRGVPLAPAGCRSGRRVVRDQQEGGDRGVRSVPVPETVRLG